MPNKIKKLYKKTKERIKNIASLKKRRAKSLEAKPKLLYSTDQSLKLAIQENSDNKGTNVKKERFQGIKEKIKSFKTKSKELGKGNMFKNGFKKLKGKLKSLNPIKAKKNKIIGSKKLAFLLSAGTIIAILPMFNLTPFPALAITSACVFSINFIAVKTLKKVIKQNKAKTTDEPKKLDDVAIEPAKKDPKQISIDLD